MKTVLATLLLLLSASGMIAQNTNHVAPAKISDDELGEKLQQAVILTNVGLYDEAETRCNEILEQRPDQPTVKQLLREIEERRRRAYGQDPGYELKRKLKELIVPEVNFREADPKAVMDYLRAESKKLTRDKTEINFVWLVPADEKLPRVTLGLQKVPFLDVVRYTTEAAKLRYRVDSHAVVIYKESPPTPVKPESNVQPQ
jgi:hypothetical protein